MSIALFALVSSAFAAWPDHAAVAEGWVDEIKPENNLYEGDPSVVWRDEADVLHTDVVCGGYVAQLLLHSHDTLYGDVLDELTGSSSPDSAQWKDAIDGEVSYTDLDGKWQLHKRFDADDLARGDILAAEYTDAGGTGHTMVVLEVGTAANGHAPTRNMTSKIPTIAKMDRYWVRIGDSTESIHWNDTGSTDTRYHDNADGTNDTGIGEAEIYVYANTATGEIVGWSWSTFQGTPYQNLDATAIRYRPISAGWLTGPGL